MAAPQMIQLRIVGAQELIDPLADELRKHPQDVTELSTKKVEGPQGFEFGLFELAAITAILSFGFTVGSFCLTLLEYLRKAPDNKKMIKIVSSQGEVEIRWSADLTKEQIQELIESIAAKD